MWAGSQKQVESPRLENLCSLNSYSPGRFLYFSLKLSRFFKHSNMQLTSYKFHSSPLLIIKLIINLGSSFLTDKMFEILPWSSFISFLPKPGCSLKSSRAVFSNKLSSAPPLEISGSEN